MSEPLQQDDPWSSDPGNIPWRDNCTGDGSNREVPKTSGPLPFEWLADIKPQLEGMWLIKRLLPANGLALIYGHPGSGKSFLALDMAMHVSLGWDWAGRKTARGLVVYVGAEGATGLRNRIAAFRSHHDLNEAPPFALIPTPIDLQDPSADTRHLIEQVRRLAEMSNAMPALIIIDTLSKTFGGGKENTDDMAVYIANCQRVASEFDCLVMPVHHRPKDAESTEPRGHGSLKGGVDAIILVEAGKTKSAEVTKQKDGEIGERFLFNLRVVELGEDEDGEPVTSCVVELTDAGLTPKVDPFARAIGKLSAGPRLAYGQLGELISSSGIAVPTGIPDEEINRMMVSKVASLEAWRDKSISAAGTEAGHSRDTGKKAFNRALQTLRSRGIVRVWNEWAWITHQIAGT